MNHLLILITSLFFFNSIFIAPTHAATAQDELFLKYKVNEVETTCKEIDFRSYFKAEQLKTHILKYNTELTKPNFAGHYLLLKAELMIETIWYIVDCKTGKIIHETIDGNLQFNIDSTVVISEPKASKASHDPQPLNYQVWSGTEWIKIDAPAAIVTTSTNTATTTSNEKSEPLQNAMIGYENLFLKYPVNQTHSEPCKPLDFNSFFRAQSGKANILKLNPNLKEPNFAGHYLVLKNELIFDTIWLVADCQTGKFLPDTLTGSTQFKKTSQLLILNNSNEYSKLYLLNQDQWIQISDPIQNKAQAIKNRLAGDDAKKLFEAVPHIDKSTTVRFQDWDCSLDFIKNWGMKKISGKCTGENGRYICEIESKIEANTQ